MGKITKEILRKAGLDHVFVGGDFTLIIKEQDDWRDQEMFGNMRVYDGKVTDKRGEVYEFYDRGANIVEVLEHEFWDISKNNQKKR